MSRYVWTDDMREISGLGGSYEADCRAMVVAALEWMDQNPEAADRLLAARALSIYDLHRWGDMQEAMGKVCTGGMTGANVAAAVSHARTARNLGWDAYVAKMRELRAEQERAS